MRSSARRAVRRVKAIVALATGARSGSWRGRTAAVGSWSPSESAATGRCICRCGLAPETCPNSGASRFARRRETSGTPPQRRAAPADGRLLERAAREPLSRGATRTGRSAGATDSPSSRRRANCARRQLPRTRRPHRRGHEGTRSRRAGPDSTSARRRLMVAHGGPVAAGRHCARSSGLRRHRPGHARGRPSRMPAGPAQYLLRLRGRRSRGSVIRPARALPLMA